MGEHKGGCCGQSGCGCGSSAHDHDHDHEHNHECGCGCNHDHEDSDREPSDQGAFVASVLLLSAVWDKQAYLKLLNERWGIALTEDDDSEVGSEEDEEFDRSWTLVTMHNNMHVVVSLMPGRVPNEEAEHYAPANYMWPEALDAAKSHQAHLLVA